MPSFVTVTGGATAQAQDVNQLINAMNGTAGQGVPISLTAVNDSVNFALAVKNADPTNSRSLQVLRANNNVLIQADANGVIVSPDGGATTGQVLTVNATQTLTAKTLTSPTITGTVAGGATYTAPHLTTAVVDSGGLQVVAGGLTVTAGTVQLVGPVQVGSAGWAAAGDVRFGNGGVLAWRNGAGTGDVSMGITAGNAWSLSGFLTAAAATAGGVGVPATCSGFLVAVQGGVTYKIPLYAN